MELAVSVVHAGMAMLEVSVKYVSQNSHLTLIVMCALHKVIDIAMVKS